MRPRAALALFLSLVPQMAWAESSVVAVNGPLAAMARAIGGEAVSVTYPVPEGTNPALWRPSIAEIGEIQGADLILLNGADFAGWAAKTTLPRARTLVTSRSFEDAFIEMEAGITHSHGGEGAHSHTGTAPLTWLDFGQAAEQAQAIATRLTRLEPEASDDITTRAEALSAELAKLDARAQALGQVLAGRTVLADHPGYEYFARAYELNLIALDWPPGEALGPERLDALTSALENEPVLFLWQADPAPEAAQAVAAAGLPSAILDPGAANTGDFPKAMDANLIRLQEAVAEIE